MSEEVIQWMHDCPPGHELRLRERDGQIEATCVEIADVPIIPTVSGQVTKWSGVHKVVVDWSWNGTDFVVNSVEVSFLAEDDPAEEPA